MTRDPFEGFLERAPGTIADALKLLLETKHLYQRVTVPFGDLSVQLFGALEGKDPEAVKSIRSKLYMVTSIPWLPSEKPPMKLDEPLLAFRIPNVKIYCDTCRRPEPFHPTSSYETSRGPTFAIKNPNPIPFETEKITGGYVQHWSLGYRCQSCLENQSAFLVRRSGYFMQGGSDMKLQLCGRAPIEHITIPGVVPKQEARFFEGASVAMNSGEVLAAIFLLRTMVEQFCRRITGRDAAQGKSGGDIVAEYMTTLPNDFKQRFPSLVDIYSRLSIPIHEADQRKEETEYPALFAESTGQVIRHFDARRLFGLNQGAQDPALER